MKCPTCSVEFPPDSTTAMPFCSERCREVDLGRWLDERYGMPVIPDPEADEVADDESATDEQPSATDEAAG